ncbi:carbohydrate kinase family protein [Planosporangium mesophilum]|uniref:Ribokinase n=1 Tax=Planosporangium mesophilum TaxID=689768 RepID=A0A8J3X120_9ACTN|nr:PfkB family carbohydrate kinase [Planosporangium mesophilum]NJC81830.1 ribokinase [Planosporangium mesophilum]GII20508.1 ribokinase [Planosporangium mesophilum]
MTTAAVVVGDLATDVVARYELPLAAGSDTPAHVRILGGGSGANTAAWLAASGVPTTFVGVVGADEAGSTRVAELAATGVRASVRRAADTATGSVVVLSRGGDRTMLSERGANRLLSPADVDAGLATGAGHLHLSGYTLLEPPARDAGRYALAAAARAGLTTSVDLAAAAIMRRLGAGSFLDWVRGADLLLANVDEASALVGDGTPVELAVRLAGWAGHAVVKCGAAGAVWASAGGEITEVAAAPASVVDPTGAGDAFAAGLLSAWLSGGSPEEALRAGTRTGAAAVGLVGGRPAPPRR